MKPVPHQLLAIGAIPVEAELESAAKVIEEKALPELRFLKVENLTTFPMNLQMHPLPGINVIFGGNYSGKTTIVNSVKFGLFGLTLHRDEEETSARYFGSRIRESERKSMDITSTFSLNRLVVTVKRKLFASGPQSIDVQIVDPDAAPGGGIVESHNTSRDYLASFTRMMGLDSREEIEFVLNLLIADEDRSTVLWKKDCGRVSLKLLVPAESYARLRWLDQQLYKKRGELSKTTSAAQAAVERLQRQSGIKQFFESESVRLHSSESEDTLRKFSGLQNEYEETVQHLQQLQEDNQNLLSSKASKLTALVGLRDRERTLALEIDDLKTEKYRAILKSTDPEDIHVTKHLIHVKRCPYCDADLGAEMQKREAQHLCFLCGNEIGEARVRGIPEINTLISAQEKKLASLTEEVQGVTSEISSVDTKLVELDGEIKRTIAIQSGFSAELAVLRQVKELHEKVGLIDENLRTIGERVKSDTSECERLDKASVMLRNEVAEIESLRRKGEELARSRSREIFNMVSARFADFVKLATNGEIDASLADDMVSSLQGRKIYSADDASQFERTILDVGFRLALISTIAEQGGYVPFLILETPDETADESYIEHFAEALRKFSSHISLLITSSNTEFMKTLMKDSAESDRKNRLIDLSERGTDTQKSYYSPLITQWLGFR